MPVTPTVGQTITYKTFDHVNKGVAIVVAANYVIATAQNRDGGRTDSTPHAVPVANVLTAV